MATIERAISIAATVHAGVKDKSGTEPYLFHPLRVMVRMDSEAARIVGVLHDVVEDSKEMPLAQRWTFDRLRDEGFSSEVLEALDGITDRPGQGEGYEEFVKRASLNPISRQVKIADLEDNMNILRIREVRDKDLDRLARYHRSWLFLKGVELGQ